MYCKKIINNRYCKNYVYCKEYCHIHFEKTQKVNFDLSKNKTYIVSRYIAEMPKKIWELLWLYY